MLFFIHYVIVGLILLRFFVTADLPTTLALRSHPLGSPRCFEPELFNRPWTRTSIVAMNLRSGKYTVNLHIGPLATQYRGLRCHLKTETQRQQQKKKKLLQAKIEKTLHWEVPNRHSPPDRHWTSALVGWYEISFLSLIPR